MFETALPSTLCLVILAWASGNFVVRVTASCAPFISLCSFTCTGRGLPSFIESGALFMRLSLPRRWLQHLW